MDTTKNRGFTLIELLVVIAIIGLLVAITLGFLSSAREKANDAKRISDFGEMKKALELYFNDNNRYPSSSNWQYSTSWGTSFASDLSPYLSSLPVDPINNTNGPWSNTSDNYTYAYRSYESGSTYELVIRLQTPHHRLSCEFLHYLRYNETGWCSDGGGYSQQLVAAKGN